MTTNRTPEELAEEELPDDVPRPTQARADAMKMRVASGNPDEPGGGPTPTAPTVVDAPAVTVNGVAVPSCVVGDVLTATVGNWTQEPTEYWQSWLSDAAVVGDGSTYTAQASDAGHSVSCSVTATNAAGNASSQSNAVTVAAVADEPTPNLEPVIR